MTITLTKEIVARLRASHAKIRRIWIPPNDNPAGHINIVIESAPYAIGINIDEKLGEANVLRYRNADDLYFYPPRKTADDVMADFKAAQEGRLYA